MEVSALNPHLKIYFCIRKAKHVIFVRNKSMFKTPARFDRSVERNKTDLTFFCFLLCAVVTGATSGIGKAYATEVSHQLPLTIAFSPTHTRNYFVAETFFCYFCHFFSRKTESCEFQYLIM